MEYIRMRVDSTMTTIQMAAAKIKSGDYNAIYIKEKCDVINEYLDQVIKEHKGLVDIINNIKNNLK